MEAALFEDSPAVPKRLIIDDEYQDVGSNSAHFEPNKLEPDSDAEIPKRSQKQVKKGASLISLIFIICTNYLKVVT